MSRRDMLRWPRRLRTITFVFLVLSFTSDWLYPTYQSLELVGALRGGNSDVAFTELPSTYGHDAFLLETKEQNEMVTGFLESVFQDLSRKQVRPIARRVSEELQSRQDYAMIGEMIEPGSRVLDLGCGDGELLAWLCEQKQIDGRGVEIEGENVRRAIARGVSVYQGDIDEGLADYPDGSFDFVILSQTLQEMRYPLRVLREMLRVGASRDCGVSEFRSLAGSAGTFDERTRAEDEVVSLRLV